MPDGLHLNAEGQRIVAEGWIAKLYPVERANEDVAN
jgi:lysophospholipase L1-like esterase